MAKSIAKDRGASAPERTTAAALAQDRRHLLWNNNVNFAASEAYKLLRTNLIFSFTNAEECHVLGMVSTIHSEGKSTTSANLAYTIAEAGKRVLLIEGDLRLPTMSRRFQIEAAPGLSNYLAGICTMPEAIQRLSISNEDGNEIHLDAMVAGNRPPNPSELLGTPRMQELIELLKQQYDFILIDLPPVTEVTDALIMSRITDGLIIVVRHDVAERSSLSETLRQVQLVGGRILGFVFNGARASSSGYYKKHGYYKYGYGNKYAAAKEQ